MFKKCLLVLSLTAMALAEGEFPNSQRDATVLRLQNNHHAPKARTQWAYHALDDSYRPASEGVSHGYAAPTLRTTESEYPSYSTSTVADYWRPNSGNVTVSNSYSYSRPYSTSSGTGSYYKDPLRGTYSMYQYQQSRPGAPVKKIHPHYVIGKLPDSKTKYKKTVLYQSVPSTYKKLVHPRVHKPYAKHKYPTQKTVHPIYRRYYQSPYQRYSIPFSDILRHKTPTQSEYQTSGSSPTPSSNSYHTTERMDDTYPDGSAPSEDYSHYNSSGIYYDGYEESEKSADTESAYDETTTRNYYGDRIYMSTQVPVSAPDKPTSKSSYYIIRRTSDADDDIETIFE